MNSNQINFSVTGLRIGQPNENIWFNSQANGVGTFPLTYLAVNQFDSATLVTPFNINITTWGAAGQFVEGNFTGQIRDLLTNNLHTVSATFRARRYQ
jgi:hypothetical protein